MKFTRPSESESDGHILGMKTRRVVDAVTFAVNEKRLYERTRDKL